MIRSASANGCPSAATALLLIAVLIATGCRAPDQGSPLRVTVSFPTERSATPLDGRILLMVSNHQEPEPRFQVNVFMAESPPIFGIDVNELEPDEEAIIDAGVFGYPLESLSDLPPGEYWVQALLHRYETFTRSDGHTLKLPMDRGEGQVWQTAPGNLFSTPERIRLDPRSDDVIRISLDQEIPPLPPYEDTEYVRYVQIESKLLSEFWGRPMHLGAIVLLPEGHEDHPDARYPLMINHGHFEREFRGFSETPPGPGLEGPELARAERDHAFYRQWTGPAYPRMLYAKIQHANPYYDDSYAVNSANVGPYGDAINYELIPEIERRFRGIGEGWARGLHGGSTGGWEVLGSQIFYPDEYNGAWAACPDVVNFHVSSLARR